MHDPSDYDKLFGRIAVELGHITPDQLVEAVLLQNRDGKGRKLGELLLDRGWIGSDQLVQILGEQFQRTAGGASSVPASSPPKPAPTSGRVVVTVPATRPAAAPSTAPGIATVPRPPAVAARPQAPAAPAAPTTPVAAPSPGPPLAAVPPRAPTTAVPRQAPATSPPPSSPATAAPRETPATSSPPKAPATAAPREAPATSLPPRAPATAAPRATSATLDHLLRQAIEQGASDLHLHSDAPPLVRVAGTLRELSPTAFSREQLQSMLRAALPAPLLAKLDADKQIDFVHTVPGVARFRANAYRQQRGLDLVLRAIPPQPPTLESLGLPATLARLTNHHQGLVLITGPSGCGKTSTLAALVNLINQERRVHILTAEEPIEYVQPSRRALVNQREIGTHSESFARMLRGALREDPDVIALGDLRDHDTISLALTAAETGHLVMATMHTGGAIRTVNRLIGAFPPNEQDQVRIMVSESLRAIVSQRLVPLKDGSGRVPAIEVLIATRGVSNLIRERKMFQIENLIQLGTSEGMCTLDQSLDRLIASGAVTKADAAFHRPDNYIVADISGGPDAPR